MKIAENKILIILLIVALIGTVANCLFIFTVPSKNYDYHIDHDQIFNLSIEKQSKNNYSFSTKNHLKRILDLNKFSSDITVILYDIDDEIKNDPRLFDLLELPINVKFGFITSNDALLQKAIHYNHSTFLKISLNSKDEGLLLDPTKNFDKNSQNNIKNNVEKYKSGLYLMDNQIEYIKDNQQFINSILDLKPIIVSNKDSCDDRTKICFISDKGNFSENIKLRLEEIFNYQNKSNDQWFLIIKYNHKNLNEIKQLVSTIETGFLDIDKNTLKQILSI